MFYCYQQGTARDDDEEERDAHDADDDNGEGSLQRQGNAQKTDQ